MLKMRDERQGKVKIKGGLHFHILNAFGLEWMDG